MPREMRAVDLFCGAGGATKGLQRAGFKVLGVDISPQPRYCGDWFVQVDALSITPEFLSRFDFVWASPPCQAHTALRMMKNARAHADLVPQTRALLVATARPWVIENVEGAPLRNAFTLCGTQFGLGIETHELRRHRIFETNTGLAFSRRCAHRKTAIGIYGDHARASRVWSGPGSHFPEDQKVALASRALDIDWMSWPELCQAIPPAYSEFIALRFIDSLPAHSAA